jgi:hypothetical protein
MAYYLVTAVPRTGRLPELQTLLERGSIEPLRPFGPALTLSLMNARLREDGLAVWEVDDYCTPPLKEERAAVLDRFFSEMSVEKVRRGAGWRRVANLPLLFPKLGGGDDWRPERKHDADGTAA